MAAAAPWIATAAGAALDAYGNKRAGDKAAAQAAEQQRFMSSYEGSPEQARIRRLLGAYFTGPDAPTGSSFWGGDLANMAESRYREYLDPDYARGLETGSMAYDALDQYRDRTKGAWLADLNDALNETRARIGGQYGVRFGGDITDMLGEQGRRATTEREAVIAGMFPEMWKTSLAGAQTGMNAPLLLEQWLSSRRAPLMQFATSNMATPTFPSYPTSGGLGSSLGSSLGNFPMMWYLYGNKGGDNSTLYTHPSWDEIQ